MSTCHSFSGYWEIIPTLNPGPSPRCGHTLTIHGNHSNGDKYGKLLVSFGESSLLSDRKYLNDMHILDLSTMKWTQILGKHLTTSNTTTNIKCNFEPIKRADHASTAFGTNNDRALIFGGKCKDTYLDDLILIKNISSFNPSTKTECITLENNNIFNESPIVNNFNKKQSGLFNNNNNNILNDNKNYLRIDPIHLSKGPCGRRGASLTSWKDGSFLLFGGQRGNLFLNDLWGLDLHKQGWVQLSTKNNPSNRAFHSAFVDDQHKVLILGGVKDVQANPVNPDIYKLDLRTGKFMKLGDKDMVPGLADALSKGHHSSHFLHKKSDLAIFSPQNASCHILGGNTQSEYCGQCCPINSINSNKIDNFTNLSYKPTGTCRPATTILPSDKCITSLKSYGCRDQPLERLFVLGGYMPQKSKCDNILRSLKFSTIPCNKSNNHQCKFTPTYQVRAIQEQLTLNKNELINDNNNTNNISLKLSNNVTPMRNVLTKNNKNISNNDILNNSLLDNTILQTPNNNNINNNNQYIKKYKVTLARTPVRTLPTTNLELQRINIESYASKQKIARLDPELLDLLPYNNNNNNNNKNDLSPTSLMLSNNNNNNNNNFNRKTLHWQMIETILLNFKNEYLNPHCPFLFTHNEILQLCDNVIQLFKNEDTMLNIEPPVKIFGDIHGQLGDLMSLFKAYGSPDHILGDIKLYKYIFLGDFVDRGHKSLEVICLLFALKLQYPDRIYLIRGNHECNSMNELYGFHQEIRERILSENMFDNDNDISNIENKSPLMNTDDNDIDVDYDASTDDDDDNKNEININNINNNYNKKYKFINENEKIQNIINIFNDVFNWLPLAGIIGGKILCVHGGIGQLNNLNQISNIKRPCEVVCEAAQQPLNNQQQAIVDILWSDPAENDQQTGFEENKRGVSCVFGSDIVRKFCKTNDIQLIVRAHQVVKDGFEYFAGGHLITLFSATNYCDIMDNAGAILCIDNELRVVPKIVEPKENIPPQYNNNINNTLNNNDNDIKILNNENKTNNNHHNWRDIEGTQPSPMRSTKTTSNIFLDQSNLITNFINDDDNIINNYTNNKNNKFQSIKFS